MTWRTVTDKQWKLIETQLPKRKPNPKGGRPPVSDRQCFEGILWVLWTGAPWSELPERYGSKSTVHRRLSEWAESGVLLNLWRALLDQLNDRQKVRWNECFMDGMFVSAKKGARKSVKPSAVREQSSWYWPMARVLRSEYTWRRLPRQK
jgi:transposase